MKSKVKDFTIIKSEIIDELIIFKPSVNIDSRGSIYSTFHKDVFQDFIPKDLSFKHDKFSESTASVLRGIHGDIKSWKLVTCVYGEVFQVVVDCRPDSPTYLKWEGFLINKENPISVLLTPGMGNAFYVTGEKAVYHYKLAYSGEYLDAQDQFTLKWNDPAVGIKWPNNNPVLSDRDK